MISITFFLADLTCRLIMIMFVCNSRIFSEIDEPLDFNETLVNGRVLDVVSINTTLFLRKSLFQKSLAFKVIHFVCNCEERKTFIFNIYCMIQKKMSKEHIYLCVHVIPILPGAGYSKITYERALRAVKSNSGKCSVSVTLIAIPKPHLRSS